MDYIARLGSPEADRLAPQSWADLAIHALHAGSGPRDLPVDEADSGYGLIRHMDDLAALHRQSRKLDEASRVAERMLALGRLLVERNPHRPMAHVALGEAYIQMSKNAWRTYDWPVIEANLRLSLDAAVRAIALEPDNEIARYLIEQRQRRLKELPSLMSAPGNPDRALKVGNPGS